MLKVCFEVLGPYELCRWIEDVSKHTLQTILMVKINRELKEIEIFRDMNIFFKPICWTNLRTYFSGIVRLAFMKVDKSPPEQYSMIK
jgi:hypothetical protein